MFTSYCPAWRLISGNSTSLATTKQHYGKYKFYFLYITDCKTSNEQLSIIFFMWAGSIQSSWLTNLNNLWKSWLLHFECLDALQVQTTILKTQSGNSIRCHNWISKKFFLKFWFNIYIHFVSQFQILLSSNFAVR